MRSGGTAPVNESGKHGAAPRVVEIGTAHVTGRGCRVRLCPWSAVGGAGCVWVWRPGRGQPGQRSRRGSRSRYRRALAGPGCPGCRSWRSCPPGRRWRFRRAHRPAPRRMPGGTHRPEPPVRIRGRYRARRGIGTRSWLRPSRDTCLHRRCEDATQLLDGQVHPVTGVIAPVTHRPAGGAVPAHRPAQAESSQYPVPGPWRRRGSQIASARPTARNRGGRWGALDRSTTMSHFLCAGTATSSRPVVRLIPRTPAAGATAPTGWPDSRAWAPPSTGSRGATDSPGRRAWTVPPGAPMHYCKEGPREILHLDVKKRDRTPAGGDRNELDGLGDSVAAVRSLIQ